MVAGALVLLGCEAIIGANFDDATARPDAGEGTAATICGSEGLPVRPELGMSGDDIDFVVVLDPLDFGDRLAPDGTPEYLNRGFDLDNRCTNQGQPSECTLPDWVDPSADVTDGPQGQDNAVGRFIFLAMEQFMVDLLSSDLTNSSVANGTWAPFGVLRVRGFSGFSIDDSVEVEWFVPTAMSRSATMSVPTFTTADRWPILTTSAQNPSAMSAADTVSVHRDRDAYVDMRRLVARFERVRLSFANNYFEARELVLTAEPVRDVDGTWTLENGTLGAIIDTADFLPLVPAVSETSLGVQLCTDDGANWAPIKAFICALADTPAEGATDPSQPCRFTSLGASFGTRPAALGDLVQPEPIEICTPETDPARDTCEQP